MEPYHSWMITLVLWTRTPINSVGFVLWNRRVICGHIGETDENVLVRKLKAKSYQWLRCGNADGDNPSPAGMNHGTTSEGIVQCDLPTGEVLIIPSCRQLGPECEHLVQAIGDYFTGRRFDLSDIPIDLGKCTGFTQAILEKCRAIPYGDTVTYRQLAIEVGRPKAARAVAQALARNPIPIIVPCHRVIGSDGSLRGFSAPGGIKTKKRLITMEKERISHE